MTTHLHDSADVTRAALDRFVHSSVDVQLLVLAELRMRAEDQEVTILPALQASAVSILAVFLAVTPDAMKFAVIAPPTAQGGLAHWLSITTGFLIYAVVVGIILAPSMFHGVRRNNARAVAAAWLSAYERELDRWREALIALPRRGVEHTPSD